MVGQSKVEYQSGLAWEERNYLLGHKEIALSVLEKFVELKDVGVVQGLEDGDFA